MALSNAEHKFYYTLSRFLPLDQLLADSQYPFGIGCGRMLRMIHTKTILLIYVMLLGGFLLACQPQEPVYVYVTPTLAETASPTSSPTASATPQMPTLTVTSTPQPSPETAAATNTPLGAVIGGDYVLPPTSTAIPSVTSVPVTLESSATPTVPLPSNTPQPAGPPPTALPNLDPARMGIQLDPNLSQADWNAALADIQRLGVKWLKVQVSWKQLQPNAPGEVSEDFRRLEIYLETAYNNGLDILISIAKAPAWARSNQTEDGPPDDPQALVQFINLITEEFGTSLDAIEIWNEPNLSREWQGQPLNGQSYMRYFVPAYQAITAYAQRMVTDPKTPRTTPLYVITAGLAPTGDNPTIGSRNDRSYLEEMYAAGLGNYPDIFVGVHPYSWGNPPDATCCQMEPEPGWDDDPHFFFMNNMQDFRQIMVSNGHAEQRLFVTEFGYATWEYLPGDPPQPWMSYIGECQQGAYLVRAFQLAQSWDYVGPVILWNLNIANQVTVQNRDEMAAYSMIVPLEPRERAAYWMLYDAIRPDLQLSSYSRCPGPG